MVFCGYLYCNHLDVFESTTPEATEEALPNTTLCHMQDLSVNVNMEIV